MKIGHTNQVYLNKPNLTILFNLNIFTKGLDKDDKKGLLKWLENIKDKNEELLKEIKNQKTKELGNKDSRTAKAKNSLICEQNHNFSNISIESNFDILEMLYREFISLKSIGVKRKKILIISL